MAKTFPAQRAGVNYLTEGGQETELMYGHGFELPEFAMFLVETPDDIRGHTDECPERRSGPDAVFPPVPGWVEDKRDLLEVVDEEPLAFFAELGRLARSAERIAREELLQFLRQRCLRDATLPDTQQFDFVIQRRIVAVIQRADDVVGRGQ